MYWLYESKEKLRKIIELNLIKVRKRVENFIMNTWGNLARRALSALLRRPVVHHFVVFQI